MATFKTEAVVNKTPNSIAVKSSQCSWVNSSSEAE